MLFLLKLTLTPVIVALMSIAARRWGPMIGGLIMGLPWMTGPILFFLGLEHGETYVAHASTGVLIGVLGIAGYLIAYVYVGKYAPWPISLVAGALGFGLSAYAISGLDMSLVTAAIVGGAGLFVAYLLIPRVSDPGGLRFVPWWDIPMRMAATAVLVGIITLSANMLGPEVIGIVSTYPVILTVLSTFMHAQWGWLPVVHLARGMALSLLSFVMFFLVLGLTAESLGLVWAYVASAVAALVVSLVLVLSNQIGRGRSPKAT